MFRFQSKKQFEVDWEDDFLPPLLRDAFNLFALKRNFLPRQFDRI